MPFSLAPFLPYLEAGTKFAVGGASGVAVGLIIGWVYYRARGQKYVHAAAVGYVAGFFVNFGVILLLGNLAVRI